MVNLDQRTKEVLKKLTDANGQIAITDSMPDDLKKAITNINKYHIDVFSDHSFDENDDAEELEVDDNIDSIDFLNSSVNQEMNQTVSDGSVSFSDDIQEDDSNVSDLNDIF